MFELKLLNAVLQTNWFEVLQTYVLNKYIKRLWQLPGMIIVSTSEQLHAFFIAAATSLTIDEVFAFPCSPNDVISIFHIEDDHIVIVLKSGSMMLWKFTLNFCSLSLNKTFDLCSKDQTIDCVQHSKLQDSLYWQSRRSDGFYDAFVLTNFKQKIQSTDDENCLEEMHLLSQCPRLSIFTLAGSSIFTTREGPLTNLFLRWQPASLTFDLCSWDSGHVLSEHCYGHAVNFRELIGQCVPLWSEQTNVTMEIEVSCGKEDRVLFISANGSVKCLTNDEDEVRLFQLNIDEDFNEDVQFVMTDEVVISMYEESIRFYNYENGEVLQELVLHDEQILGATVSQNILAFPIVWTNKHIYQIWPSYKANLESQPKMTNYRAVLTMEDIYHHYKTKSDGEQRKDVSDLLDPDRFASPALLLALLGEAPGGGSGAWRERLMERVREAAETEPRQGPTPLAKEIAPLLQAFWTLEKSRREPAVSISIADTVREQVETLLSAHHPHLSLLQCYSMLQILADQNPQYVTQCVQEFLQITVVKDQVFIDPDISVRWKNLLAPLKNELSGHLESVPLFEFVVCLIMKSKPDLVDVVCSVCQKVSHHLSSPSAFTTQHCIKDFYLHAVETLPPIHHFSDNKHQVVLTMSRLLGKSQAPNKPVRCVELLLAHSEWGESVRLLEQHAGAGRDPETHRQMFSLILQAALKEKTLHLISSSLLKNIPPNVSSQDVLSALHQSLESDNNIFVQENTADIPISVARNVLEKKL